MSYSFMIRAASGAIALTLFAVPAGAFQHDGGLVIYPRGAVSGVMTTIPGGALQQGVPYQQKTSDSVHQVDMWYRANAPKSCARLPSSGGVRYRCPGGFIVIQQHGGTLISYVPSFPGIGSP